MKYWQKACIWLTRKNIYVLKTQRSWYGTVQSRQACMYTCQSEWMRGGSYTETLIHQLVKTYGLQSYRISVLVGDTALIWKKLAVPSKKKEEACQMAVWDEALGDGSRMYTFDLQMTGKEQPDGTYEWMLGAYPYDLIAAMLDAFETHDCLVERVDIVPAAAGRLCPQGEGTLYLHAGTGEIHVIGLKQGVPLSYGMTSQLPQDAVQWLEAAALMPEETVLWLDEPTQCWLSAPIRASVKKQQTQWDIWGPAVLLTAF